MLIIHNLPRGSGKTGKFIEALIEDPKSIGLSTLPQYAIHQLYPEDVKHRIYTINDLRTGVIDHEYLGRSLIDSRCRKIKVDEGLIGTVDTAHLFYDLGSQGWDVEVWGTAR